MLFAALDVQAMGSKPFSEQLKEAEKRRQPTRKSKIGRRMPALISHKGRNDKVIGEREHTRCVEC